MVFDITLSSVDRVLKRVSQATVHPSGRFIRWPNGECQWWNITTKGQICWVAGVAAMLTMSIQASEKLGPSRNGRMEQNFPVIPIFRNIGTTSRGTPKIPKWDSGKFPFHSLPHPEFPEFLVEWKAPVDGSRISKTIRGSPYYSELVMFKLL